ncbi:MAG: T9SS type A sorting domain-containing protein [Bacteroidales bacterium]|nr:T9SS type A sorting domain-containing protein [Bacteroidales bacterium]MCF8403182.1 T9SS type A sorting domain-containing protein [Bacteroidales bacterium]
MKIRNSGHTVIILISLIVFIGCTRSPSSDQKLTNHQYPNDWFYNQRAYPSGTINYEKYYESLKNVSTIAKENKSSAVWEFEGPLNIGGRLSDVESHPDIPSTIFAGTASGGIFKSTDNGASWEAVFEDALSLSIGDIAIAPNDYHIMYAGTGEANAGGGSQTYEGNGIYLSTDEGNTWEEAGLPESRNIGRLAVHPESSETVYAAAMGNLFADTPDRGIYKTTNGGVHWENVLYISDSTGAIDVAINPTDPEIVYAVMWERVRRPNRRSYGGPTSAIYRSTDEGNSWTKLTNGLPGGSDIGRIGISICEAEPEIIYAIYADKIGYFKGVYKSTDGGNFWSQVNDGALNSCYQSYGWWFGRIKTDPVNPNIAYVVGFDLYKTNDGGDSWANISAGSVHVDQHEIYINPLNNNQLLLGNDGGLYTSENGGNNWIWINNLPITQFYTCEIDSQHPERIYGGTQDNGTNRTLSGGIDDWENIYGGDGFYVLVDPENPNYIFVEYQYGNLARSTDGGVSFTQAMNGINSGDRMNWNTPIVFNPANPFTLYYGSEKVYKSTNHAESWTAISNDLTNGPGVNLTYGTITTISVSPINEDLIYVGTDDGNVWRTADGGQEWTKISADLPNRWVTRVIADPHEEQQVYVTFSGYRWDEFLPHVFSSGDMGQTWYDITSDLPEVPVNDLIVDPQYEERLYIASDAGVFVTYNGGLNWGLLGSNLPKVPVTSLDLHQPSHKLLAATFGRSMYTYDLLQDTVLTRVNNISDFIPEVIVFPNPWMDILYISFSLRQSGSVSIELFDLSGKLVYKNEKREFLSGDNQILASSSATGIEKCGTYILKLGMNNVEVSKKIIFRN